MIEEENREKGTGGGGRVSAGRHNGGEYPIDRDEGEENSRRNERASERSACEFRLVSHFVFET